MNTDCNRTRLKAATKGSPKVHCSSMPHESQSTPRSPQRGPSNIPRHSSRASCRSLCTSTTTHCESPPFLRKPPACTAHTRPLGNDDSPDQSGDQWIKVYLTLHRCTRNHQRTQAEPEHTYQAIKSVRCISLEPRMASQADSTLVASALIQGKSHLFALTPRADNRHSQFHPQTGAYNPHFPKLNTLSVIKLVPFSNNKGLFKQIILRLDLIFLWVCLHNITCKIDISSKMTLSLCQTQINGKVKMVDNINRTSPKKVLAIKKV